MRLIVVLAILSSGSDVSAQWTAQASGTHARLRGLGVVSGEVAWASGTGGTLRDRHNTVLAGAGYAFPVGGNVALYASALYDFNYDQYNVYSTYDSPVRYQVGVAVGF
jgi:hypothetical protein